MYNENKNIFTQIHDTWSWGSYPETRSGPGSSIKETRVVVEGLSTILSSYGIKTMLDASCGDFNWMKDVSLSGIKYLGSDIVDDLIKNNKEKYSKKNIKFIVLDVIEDNLPQVDLILLRDTLFHFTNNDVKKTINNIKRSGAKYLLTTSYKNAERVARHTPSILTNLDIPTGKWRFLNLQVDPFNLPEPIERILECEWRPAHEDKSLCLWLLDDIEYFDL